MASEEFKQLLEEQKKTNDLLTLANKDPSLGSSIRQNLGEILNASRLAAQNEAFSRREGITQTDDITEDVRDFVADANKIAIESDEVNSVLTRSTNAELVFIREGIAVLGTQLNRMLKDMDINRVVKRLDEITPDPDQLLKAIETPDIPPSKEEENQKNANKNIKLRTKVFNRIAKEFGLLSKEIKAQGLFKTDTSFKGILKKLGLFALLFAGMKGLTDEDLMAFAKYMDETFLPAIKTLYLDYIKPAGKFITDLIKNTLITVGVDEDTAEDIANASGLLAAATILFFAKDIAKLGLTIAMFPVKRVGKAIGGLAIAGLKLFARLLVGRLGMLIAAGFGVKAGIDEYKKTGSFQEASEEAMETFIATFLGMIPDLIFDLVGAVVGVFNEDMGKKISDISVTKYIKKQLDHMEKFFDDIGYKIRLYFVGLNDAFNPMSEVRDVFGNVNKEFKKQQEERLREAINQIKKSEDFMKQGGFVDTKTTFKLQKELEEAQFQIERIRQYELGKYDEYVERKYHGGGLQRGALALIGESASGTGGELVYTGSDAMVLNQARTDSLLTTALQKGLSGGGGDGTPIVVSSDNSVRSNISNVVSTSTVVTSNDSFTNAIVSSV